MRRASTLLWWPDLARETAFDGVSQRAGEQVVEPAVHGKKEVSSESSRWTSSCFVTCRDFKTSRTWWMAMLLQILTHFFEPSYTTWDMKSNVLWTPNINLWIFSLGTSANCTGLHHWETKSCTNFRRLKMVVILGDGHILNAIVRYLRSRQRENGWHHTHSI